MHGAVTAALFVAALGSAVLGGFILAFSDVMRGLQVVPPESGIVAMNEMNRLVMKNPLFFPAFLGTPLLSAVLAVIALLKIGDTSSWAMLVGAVLILVGVFGVTMVIHVPLNDALAGLAPSSAKGADTWRPFLERWTLWNHVRMLAGIAAAVAFMMALTIRSGA